MNTLVKVDREWKCTDANTFQHRKKVNETTFKFKEFNISLFNVGYAGTPIYANDKEECDVEGFLNKYWEQEELWIQDEVDLEDYSIEEIQDILEESDYLYDGEYVTDSKGDYFKDNGLIAELIFEFNNY